MREKTIISILIVFLLVCGCSTDDEKTISGDYPAEVYFGVGVEYDSNTSVGNFSFDSMIVSIGNIVVEANMTNGNFFSFSTDTEKHLSCVKLIQNGIYSIVTFFDLPDGYYNVIRWEVNLSKPSNSIATFEIYGKYCFSEKTMVPIVFNTFLPFQLVRNIMDADCNELSVVSQNIFYGMQRYAVSLSFNPVLCFNRLKPEMFSSADFSVIDNENCIIISESQNSNLFQYILDGLLNTANILVTGFNNAQINGI